MAKEKFYYVIFSRVFSPKGSVAGVRHLLPTCLRCRFGRQAAGIGAHLRWKGWRNTGRSFSAGIPPGETREARFPHQNRLQ
jgi:hypothetical protein